MGGTLFATRFNIQFNRDNASHLKAAEILHRQDSRGKARYIAEAILHYESCEEARSGSRSARVDEKMIEAVVKRILRGMDADEAAKPAAHAKQAEPMPMPAGEMSEDSIFDEAMEAVGEDGFNAIAGALDMFRKK
jgi:hypothetical protein